MSTRTALVAIALLLLAIAIVSPHGSSSKGPYHADLLHERAETETDAGIPRRRLALRLPGGPPDQPRARRASDRPAEPLARALPARVRGGLDRERPQRQGLRRGAVAGRCTTQR